MKTFNSNTLSVRHQFLWRKISRSSHPVAVVRKHLRTCNFIKKRLQHRCFPAKSAKFLRTPFLLEHFQWLLLSLEKFSKIFTMKDQIPLLVLLGNP